ncbi:MAG: cytidylyltransferase domain-containing protein, partial [Pyrinomonadaceae bacterium]
PIPYPREAVTRHGSLEKALEQEPELFKHFRRHTGLYAYRRQILLEYARWPKSELEMIEQLEQLRALEHGVIIKVIEVDETSIGIDTVEDLERARAEFTR